MPLQYLSREPQSYPHEIIFSPLTKDQRKKLIYRNDTPHRLVLKLQATVPSGVQLKHNIRELDPHSVTEDSFIFKPSSQTGQALLIFARMLTPENETAVRSWLEETVATEDSSHLAFNLDFHITSDRWNAQKIILDLPGSASLCDGSSLFEPPADASTACSWPNLYQMARFKDMKRAQLPVPKRQPAPRLIAHPPPGDMTLWPLVEYFLLFLLFLIAVIKLQFLH